MATLTAKQANDLGKDFLALAQAIGDFRYDNWNTLSKEDNQRLSDFQWSILNYGEDILALSVILVMDDVEASLTKINTISSKIKGTIQVLKNIQKGIDVAAAIVTLGAAIISKSPKVIADSIDGLVKSWDS
jgi:hypothetical protein